MTLSIILPVYNEEKNIPILHNSLLKVMDKEGYEYEIIYIDDGSNDNSASIVSELAKTHTYTKSILFRKNFGQSAATAAGIDKASGDIIVIMDADLQNDPKDIPNLVKKIHEGSDIVSGWRKNRKDNRFLKNIPSKIANWLIQKIGKVPIHDLGCSLKAYRREIIKEVNLYGEMHRFIAIYAYHVGAKIEEIEVQHHARQYGESKYGLGRVFKVLVDLITLKYLLNYSNKPIYFFGKISSFFFAVGTLSFLGMLYQKLFLGISFVQTPLTILTPILFVAGINIILFGVIAELQMRTYHESQSKPVYKVKKVIE